MKCALELKVLKGEHARTYLRKGRKDGAAHPAPKSNRQARDGVAAIPLAVALLGHAPGVLQLLPIGACHCNGRHGQCRALHIAVALHPRC